MILVGKIPHTLEATNPACHSYRSLHVLEPVLTSRDAAHLARSPHTATREGPPACHRFKPAYSDEANAAKKLINFKKRLENRRSVTRKHNLATKPVGRGVPGRRLEGWEVRPSVAGDGIRIQNLACYVGFFPSKHCICNKTNSSSVLIRWQPRQT